MRWLVAVVVVAACGGAQTQSEAQARAGKPIASAELRPNPDGGAPMVAPSRLEPFRTAGEMIVPPDDQKSRRGTFKFCVDVTGKVGDIDKLQSTGDGRYDAKLERAMQQWAYRPVLVDGQPTAVCSRVIFIYH